MRRLRACWRTRRKRPISWAVRRSRASRLFKIVLIGVTSVRDGVVDRRAVG
jgi:hypothetical protein